MQDYASSKYFNAGSFFEPDYELIIDPSLPFGDTVPALERQMAAFGKITGQETKATALMNDFHSRINEVKTQGEKAGTALVVMINGGHLSAYGAGSRFGFINDELGFKPAVNLEDKGKHGNPMSFELVQKTNAQQKNHVIYLDAEAMYIAGGYNAYMQLMDQLENALKNEA